MTVFATEQWADNGELIADVAKLGYLDGNVLDVTYGRGRFWTCFRPERFTACDIDPKLSPIGCSVDFRDLPFLHDSFDSVVIDPPYKLNGTPTLDIDERYGVHKVGTKSERLTLILDGVRECSYVTRRYLLVKCQDQVNGGKVCWQTDLITNELTDLGMRKLDRFDILSYRAQPDGVRQMHARRNSSTLLVFIWEY
ncbi:MAG: hypothetical protein ACR2M4_02865 [Actinomycetota bacterium]